jgi:hypothetical protein
VTPLERTRALGVPHAPREVGPLAFEIGDPEAPDAVVLFEPAVRPEVSEVEYSPGYGEKRAALALLMQRTLKAPGRMGWVMLLGEGER